MFVDLHTAIEGNMNNITNVLDCDKNDAFSLKQKCSNG